MSWRAIKFEDLAVEQKLTERGKSLQSFHSDTHDHIDCLYARAGSALLVRKIVHIGRSNGPGFERAAWPIHIAVASRRRHTMSVAAIPGVSAACSRHVGFILVVRQ